MRRNLAATASVALCLTAFGAMAANAQEAEAPPEGAIEAPTEDATIQAAAKVVQSMIDAGRVYDFKGWLGHFAPDVSGKIGDIRIEGRAALGKMFKPAFDMRLPDPKILQSGWTGDRIYIVQEEYLPDGSLTMVIYSAFEVRDGKIVAFEAYPY